jgi:nitric oxide reductase subunit B
MGATWEGFFVSQESMWFMQGLGWRLVMGIVTLAGFAYLVKDLLSIGKNPNNEK